MILREALQEARSKLELHRSEDADLEAEVLLRHVVGLDRVRFYSSLQSVINAAEKETFHRFLERCLWGEPLAYILGKKEFYGLTLKVNRDVLIPRPETELLVDKALEFARSGAEDRALAIADVGTGSGAIAIALACNLREAKIYAIDISSEALDVARENSCNHRVRNRVHFLAGDLLTPLPEPVDLMVANLPYVRRDYLSKAEPELLFEPREALDGGPDGLDEIRRLIAQAPGYLRRRGALILEIDPPQVETIKELTWRMFPGADISVARDLAGLERMVVIRSTRS